MLREKKITRGGSITIPSDLRRELGIQGGEKVKIEVQDNGDITLSRVIGNCIMCGSNDELIKLDGKYICKKCIEKINSASGDTIE